jgi:S1-C subfamily serine protease
VASNQGVVILAKNDKAPFLLAGDIITQINGQYLGSNLDLNEVIQGMLPGDSASVIYWRNKEQKTANLQIQ